MRTKVVAGPNGSQTIALTSAEETARDAEEKAWADGATIRNALAEIQRLESSVTPRRIREMTTDAGKQWVNNVEELIAIERGKL